MHTTKALITIRNVRDEDVILEARIDYLERMLEEIRQELRLIHQRINSLEQGIEQRIDVVNQRIDSWTRWIIGLILGNYALVLAILLRVFGAI